MCYKNIYEEVGLNIQLSLQTHWQTLWETRFHEIIIVKVIGLTLIVYWCRTCCFISYIIVEVNMVNENDLALGNIP